MRNVKKKIITLCVESHIPTPNLTCEAKDDAFSMIAIILATPPDEFIIWSMDLLSVATEAIMAIIFSWWGRVVS